jgi:thiol-disulfide isomerase/thioredoxin
MNDLLIGESIINILPSLSIEEKDFIIMVTSEDCAFCKNGIEELLILNENLELKLVNFLKINQNEELNRFNVIYSKYFSTFQATDSILANLQIDRFPTFILVQDGRITIKTSWCGAIKKYIGRG